MTTRNVATLGAECGEKTDVPKAQGRRHVVANELQALKTLLEKHRRDNPENPLSNTVLYQEQEIDRLLNQLNRAEGALERAKRHTYILGFAVFVLLAIMLVKGG